MNISRSGDSNLVSYQSAVAKVLGVNTSTVTNWEKHHSEPMMWVIPKIIEFLGYNSGLKHGKKISDNNIR